MSFLTNRWVALVARLVLGGFFIAASYHKVVDPPDFANAIHNYDIVPSNLIHVSALFLAWVELIAGLALVSGLAVRGGAVTLGGLCVVFIVALSYNLYRGHPTICGCFSTYEESLSMTDDQKFFQMWREIFIDFGLLLLSIQILFASARKRPQEAAERREEAQPQPA